jgi:hypothetical protein
MVFRADGTRLLLTGANMQMNQVLLKVWDATPPGNSPGD